MLALISVVCIFIACFSLIKPEKVPFGGEGKNLKMFAIYLSLAILAGILGDNKGQNQKNEPKITTNDKKKNDLSPQTKLSSPAPPENLENTENSLSKSEIKEEKKESTHEVTLSKIERFNDAYAVINYIENLKLEKKPRLLPSHWSQNKEAKTRFYAGYDFIINKNAKPDQESLLTINLSSSTGVGVITEISFFGSFIAKNKRKENKKIYMDELSALLKFLEIQEKDEIMDLLKKKGNVEKQYLWGKIEYTKELYKKENDLHEEEIHIFTINSNIHQIKINDKEFSARQDIEKKSAQIEKDENKKVEDLKKFVSSNMIKIENSCKESIKGELVFPSKADFSIFGIVDEYMIINYAKKLVRVEGRFEAMNGLGLMVPSTFFCTVNMNDISVEHIKVSLGERHIQHHLLK